MADALKDRYGPEVPRRIGALLRAVQPRFPLHAFLGDALDGYEALELMPRARHIAQALQRHLPQDYPEALELLLESLGPRTGAAPEGGLGSFLYLPHTLFVAQFGLGHFEESMRAQHELTQRFTAEFSLRPFLVRHRDATLARLALWAEDPSVHVRRLVSEGTRPRLPWAPRLPGFQRDPAPVLALLERLKDDPERYVQRSVANNLNDIGKDNPEALRTTARRWLRGAAAGTGRRWIVGHALRSAIKRGDRAAMALLGYGAHAAVQIRAIRIEPARPRLGTAVTVSFELVNDTRRTQAVLADLRVHFVKAAGHAAPKVFKLKTMQLAPGVPAQVRKRISLANLSTRRHYPGSHVVEAQLNGEVRALGSFTLVAR